MGAGVMQLVFFGQQDVFLKSNPSLTFFKKVFKTHTNFAMESIRVDFTQDDMFVNQSTILKAKIPRHADLVSQIYVVVQLPDILASPDLRFRWIKNIGDALIDNCSISIGGSQVDKQYGEYSHIHNTLTMSLNKRNSHDRLTGNITALNDPDLAPEFGNPPAQYWIRGFYTAAEDFDPSNAGQYKPSLAQRKVYIPLNFWFTKDIGNAIPLVSLQYSEVELTVEFRPWKHLYQLYYKNSDGVEGYFAPDPDKPEHNFTKFVSNVRYKHVISEAVVNCKPYLEVNYIYLDQVERTHFSLKSIDYLIEQVTRVELPKMSEHHIASLVLQNPVKEILWVVKRSDLGATNEWFNFQDDGQHIMESAKIMFNGVDRIEEKDAEYFNYLQAYQHHEGVPIEGLYMYSFSIFPDQYQPSGSVNASRINKFQIYMKLKRLLESSPYTYDGTFYVISYNFLRISSGLAGIVYNT